MAEGERTSFGSFWDQLIADPALAALPTDATLSQRTVALARTQLLSDPLSVDPGASASDADPERAGPPAEAAPVTEWVEAAEALPIARALDRAALTAADTLAASELDARTTASSPAREQAPLTDTLVGSGEGSFGTTDPTSGSDRPPSGTDPAAITAVRALPALDVVEGARAGDLEMFEVLGQGGMGVVRRARQRSLERDVAVKTLRPEVRGGDTVAALLEEARLAGCLEHPNVIPVHALGRDHEGRPVLVLKRIEGETWSALLRDPQHPFWTNNRRWSKDPLSRNLGILLEVCDAVHYAHSRGILHRDLKPENVMVGPFGEVYLMDWGLAVRAGQGPYAPGGTLAYMAPEMLDGEADERTDVFLLGAILHEVLTGQRRHAGRSRLALLTAVARSAAAEYGPEVPAELGLVANTAAHADPAQRYQDLLGFRQAILDCLEHRGSLELSQAAEERLTELRAAVAAEPPDPPRVTQLAAETRFGFRLAQRDWAANPAAREGLRACAGLVAEWELLHGSPHGAQRCVDDLSRLDADPEWLADLRQRVAAFREEVERRERLASELDPRVSQAERRRLLVVLTLILGPFLVTLIAAMAAGVFSPTYGPMIVFPLLGVTILAGVALYGRRTFLRNAFNRRVIATLLCFVSGIVLHRVVGAILEIPVNHTVIADLSITALTAAVSGAAFSVRWLFLVAAMAATGSLIAAASPAWTQVVLATTLASCAATILFFLRRRAGRGSS